MKQMNKTQHPVAGGRRNTHGERHKDEGCSSSHLPPQCGKKIPSAENKSRNMSFPGNTPFLYR